MQEDKRSRLPERHELKYFINRGDMMALAHRIGGVLALDSHSDERGEYFIRSLYFDDAYNTAYYDKMDGVMGRDKYRIRVYNLSDKTIFLERKRKRGDLIQKSSCRISRRLCEQLMEGNPSGLEAIEAPLLNDLFIEMRLNLLRPKVIVDYTREAYVHPAENVRVTFDKNLRTGLSSTDLFSPDICTVNPFDDDRQILEVKYDTYLPDFVANMLFDVPAERSAISKYTWCRSFESL